MAGYSCRPRHAQLGLRDGQEAAVLGAPGICAELLGHGAPDQKFCDATGVATDFIHFLATRRAVLADMLDSAVPLMARDGMIGAGWHGKRSKVAIGITGDVIRDLARPLWLVDGKVCDVDHILSAPKPVIRKKPQ